MGPKKEALILKAIEEREKDAGRHLLADTTVGVIRAGELPPRTRARRRLHSGRQRAARLRHLRRHRHPCRRRRAAAHGCRCCSTHASSACSATATRSRASGCRAAIRPTSASFRHESRGAAMQYFTGSKAHNIVIRDRAVQRGLKLNEYGLFTVEDDRRIAGESEEGIYEALGLQWIAPELRENRGEVEAAGRGALPFAHDAGRSARRPAHAHHGHGRPRRAGAHGGSGAGPWPRIHRHHRPQQGAWRCRTDSTRSAHSHMPPASAR